MQGVSVIDYINFRSQDISSEITLQDILLTKLVYSQTDASEYIISYRALRLVAEKGVMLGVKHTRGNSSWMNSRNGQTHAVGVLEWP